MQNYETIKKKDGFYIIEEQGVRAFLIEGEEKAMLVDTGFGTGDLKEEVLNITDKPLIVVNTHIDRDHIGCNPLFDTIYMHPKEIADYDNAAGTELIPVTEGYIFDLGGKIYEVIETPGHTPGSIMLLNRDDKILISGDSINMAPVFMFGNRRDLDTLIVSLKKMEKIKDSFKEIWPSHGECPISTDIISDLIEGAELLKEGKLEKNKPPFDMPCFLYKHKNAKFLYQ